MTPRGQYSGDSVATSFHTGTLDTTAPEADFKLNKTSRYAASNPQATSLDDLYLATFVLSQTSISETATRMVSAGDGTAAKAWTSNGPFTLSYHKGGRFTPTVTLTDVFGNETVEKLPTLRVLVDLAGPKVTITTPAKATKSSSWQVIRGTATDAETSVAVALVFVLEKRGATWYAYDFSKKKWLKGYTSATKTENKTKAEPAMMRVSANGTWKAPKIKGLTKGTLKVQAGAIDELFNIGEARPVTRKIR